MVGAACAALWATSSVAAVGEGDKQNDYGAAEARKVTQRQKAWITADHSRHEALQRDFQSGPEVTEACLSCHNEAAAQFQETIHWTWVCPADPQGVMGKNGLTMNNF
jgi:cytochrome c1